MKCVLDKKTLRKELARKGFSVCVCGGIRANNKWRIVSKNLYKHIKLSKGQLGMWSKGANSTALEWFLTKFVFNGKTNGQLI